LPDKAIIYEDTYGEKHEVELPLTSKINPEETMEKLGLPSYVDLGYYPMKCAVATLWAALNAAELHTWHPQAFEKKVSKKPIRVLLFGGAAVKIHCEHANGNGPLARAIKDTDYIVPKKQGADFCKLLLNMDNAFGTCYKAFRTKSDKIFNAMRQGQRYRIRTVNGVTDQGTPTVTVLDIFCDTISLRHEIDIKDTFEKQQENLYTIGLENLIMSKAQFIMDFPKERLEDLKKSQADYRILPYAHYTSDMLILGMEGKDVKDVCTIFLDHRLGNEDNEINADKMRKSLERDKKLALTVTLNLRNLTERPETLKKWMTKNEISTVKDRIESLLQVLPNIDKTWDKPWWNTAVETPKID